MSSWRDIPAVAISDVGHQLHENHQHMKTAVPRMAEEDVVGNVQMLNLNHAQKNQVETLETWVVANDQQLVMGCKQLAVAIDPQPHVLPPTSQSHLKQVAVVHVRTRGISGPETACRKRRELAGPWLRRSLSSCTRRKVAMWGPRGGNHGVSNNMQQRSTTPLFLEQQGEK